MKAQVQFDEYAENYDAALNQGLAVTGEGKDYFAAARIEWVARCLGDLGEKARRVPSGFVWPRASGERVASRSPEARG